MKVNLANLTKSNETVAVALSGGADSVALLHYILNSCELYQIKVNAINIEHGIRGEDSKKDTAFVEKLCKDLGVELIKYTVDCPSFAKENKMTLEQAGRVLRYNCFYDIVRIASVQKL